MTTRPPPVAGHPDDDERTHRHMLREAVARAMFVADYADSPQMEDPGRTWDATASAVPDATHLILYRRRADAALDTFEAHLTDGDTVERAARAIDPIPWRSGHPASLAARETVQRTAHAGLATVLGGAE